VKIGFPETVDDEEPSAPQGLFFQTTNIFSRSTIAIRHNPVLKKPARRFLELYFFITPMTRNSWYSNIAYFFPPTPKPGHFVNDVHFFWISSILH